MTNFSDIQIGLAVKMARHASGWSAKQLAERCGVAPTALSKIESGKQTLSFAHAYAICSALEIRVDHLVALATEVPSVAIETVSRKEQLREQLKADLKKLEQLTITTAISLQANHHSQIAPVP